MPHVPEHQEKPPVRNEIVVKDKGSEFIVQKSTLIKDPQTGEKFVTITISEKMLHYLHAGLGKYKEGFSGDSENDKTERDKTNILIEEINDIKDIINEEKVVKPFGRQEPNPINQTVGIPE